MVQKVDAFNIKVGPTESGASNNQIGTVGGEILPFSLFEFHPIQIILFLVILIPVIALLYKKRDLAFNLLSRVFF